jgi:SAM-dependent methyltransferase
VAGARDRKVEKKALSPKRWRWFDSPVRLHEIPGRDPPPKPFEEGDKIPWHDPDFSARILAEHLNQKHDLASRRFETVVAQVEWLAALLTPNRLSRVLDLGCGPGLHVHEFARRGHDAVGIDFSPAAIAWARAKCGEERLPCRFDFDDVRTADFGNGFDLVTFLFGEIDIFTDADRKLIVGKCADALAEGGAVVLEAHRPEAVRRRGMAPATWRVSPGGLFSARPHILLTEAFFDAETTTSIRRHYVVDTATSVVTRYSDSVRALAEAGWEKLLADAGFDRFRTSVWPGGGTETVVVVAYR